MSNFHNKWKSFLQEAQQDAKVLRKINVRQIRNEMPPLPSEDPRKYQNRLEDLERSEEYLNPIFPTGLVAWVESLPDNHFPRDGRKRFAKWLADSVYHQETEVNKSLDSVDRPEELNVYNNDVRYITDYFNGAENIPDNIWSMKFDQVLRLSEEWHEQFKGKEDSTGPYQTKDVVYDFENGFTIVKVPPEDLGTEGDNMGHCVGGYCEYVQSGNTVIYSLRNPNNKPHATIEVRPTLPLGRRRTRGDVEQIKGKQNEPPVPKYRGMIKQWLKTTDFSYINNYDYQQILDLEDYRADLEGDKFLDNFAIAKVAASSTDPEVVRYILDRLETIISDKGGDEFLDSLRLRAATAIEENDWIDNIVDVLTNNKRLEMAEIVRIARLGYRIGIGTGIERMLDPGSQQNYSKHYGKQTNHIIARTVYEEMKDELLDQSPREDDNKQGALLKHQVTYLSAIARQDSRARQEIVDFMLSPEMVQRQAGQGTSINYIGVLRHYLYTAGSEYRKLTKANDKFMFDIISANPSTVKRIFDFQKSEEGKKILPQTAPDQLLVSMADLPKLPKEVVNHFVEYTSKTSGVNNSKITDKVIASPGVDIEIKKKLIYNSYMKDNQHKPMQGYRYSGYAKIFSRKLYEAFPRITAELAQWLLDSGLLDALFVGKWSSTQLKNTGWSVNLEALDSEQEIELKSSIKRQKKNIQRNINIKARKEKEKLQEEIQKYFGKNMMTKNNFYDTIKEQLGIQEEKGRSRQRGIYKFYCMISYGLTADGEKTRGLDDILADMRALPNVTIVTVAVRNQKIAEGRYIAGLAIKFIPSTPGDLNTPENVKARIVRDIKRLTNVQSLFKLSTGLIRLE